MENHSISVCGGQIFKNRTDSEFSQNFEEVLLPETRDWSPLSQAISPKSDLRIVFYDPVGFLECKSIRPFI